jgi:hypothetical protein
LTTRVAVQIMSLTRLRRMGVPSSETATNYTLSSGETIPVDRRVWLDLSNPDDVKVVADVTYN